MSDVTPPRVSISPEFAEVQRRKARRAGLLGVGMSLVVLAESVNAMLTGQWMGLGRRFNTLVLPGWAVALLALFLLFISVSILRRFARKS